MNQLKNAFKTTFLSHAEKRRYEAQIAKKSQPRIITGPTMKRVFSRVSPRGIVQNQVRDVALPPRREDPRVHDGFCTHVTRDANGLNVEVCNRKLTPNDLVHGWLCKRHHYDLSPSRILNFDDEPSRLDAIIEDEKIAILTDLAFGRAVKLGPFKGLSAVIDPDEVS